MGNQILPIRLEQAEKLTELGYRLNQFRQKQRIPLERVAAQTMIPTRALAAIEAGDLEQLPEPVYIQGFIKRYADAIGMDGAEMANSFPAQAPLKSDKPSWRGTIQAQLRPLHLYLLYMALVVSAVSGLSYWMHRSTVQIVGAINPNQASEPAPRIVPGLQNGPPLPNQPASSAIPGTLPPQSIATTASQKAVRIDLTFTTQSWIRVVSDGKTEFEGVLPPGTQRTWEANKQLTLRAGDAGGVMVSLNNGQAKRLGTPGSVEEVTFGANAGGNQAASSPHSATATLTASRLGMF